MTEDVTTLQYNGINKKEDYLMGRPTTKIDLLEGANINFEKLNKLINSLSKEELSITFDFSNHEKKKEAHWDRDKNLRDILIHLHEWHNLLLNWIAANTKGEEQPFIPLPYNWKSYGEMNLVFWQNHQKTTLEDAQKMLLQSHADIMKLANTFTNEELFSKNVYKWVGGSVLGSYFVSATVSHYAWAMKKLTAHKKALAQNK